ncbi:hypothetical protein K432DRAFT_396987 [Lepidopterella palustris CBS 459.81]|uniref:Zn(2)-C6 fungal-type domain-containing protein n=1 Tax=Lepidopterella palustris CBS 459.81 TaxID=1314670 RepID=A0A8E2E1R3_9PEZI|nr:hypothetical protein K432DRAFT_396987 [Lepidopterella palustris CBS 459.81]
MSGSSRHMACKTCRDRKVRFDGGQPSCEKCKKSHETCVYVPASKQTRADLTETIEGLQERLAKAEAQLGAQQMTPRSSFSGPVFDRMAISTTQSPFATPMLDDVRSFCMQSPTTATQTAPWNEAIPMAGLPFDRNEGVPAYLGVLPDSNASTDFPCPLPFSQALSLEKQPDLSQDPSPTSPQLPSLRDIRAWNGQQQQLQMSTAPEADPDAATVFREFAVFVSAVFSIQADIVGVTSAVSEYLAWARKNSVTNYPVMLETLEVRVREIADATSSKHWVAFKQAKQSLGKSENFRRQLKALEGDLARQMRKQRSFFVRLMIFILHCPHSGVEDYDGGSECVIEDLCSSRASYIESRLSGIWMTISNIGIMVSLKSYWISTRKNGPFKTVTEWYLILGIGISLPFGRSQVAGIRSAFTLTNF